ncbi:MAG: hypothetical protein KatS3mg059_0799 [Thermomicrobiales bacterium]|nr:MAG: hypothetical protein KatS3mg059_0799 [Thermomicrobiales bacterium]
MAILDLIQYADERPDEIVHRVPEYGSGEFRLGSQLVVRESQRAVFVRDGKALDVFGPGRHTISPTTSPLLTALIGLPFGGDSPFTAEVYFVSMREFTDLKWGTPQPLVYRDPDFGMVRLRAFGTYSMRVADPQLFVAQIVGARGVYTTSAIEEFLRSIIVNEINDLLGEAKTPLLDLPGLTRELADTARNALTDDFQRLGLQLTSFQIAAITPPRRGAEAHRRALGHGGDRGYAHLHAISGCPGVARRGSESRCERRLDRSRGWPGRRSNPRRRDGPGSSRCDESASAAGFDRFRAGLRSRGADQAQGLARLRRDQPGGV